MKEAATGSGLTGRRETRHDRLHKSRTSREACSARNGRCMQSRRFLRPVVPWLLTRRPQDLFFFRHRGTMVVTPPVRRAGHWQSMRAECGAELVTKQSCSPTAAARPQEVWYGCARAVAYGSSLLSANVPAGCRSNDGRTHTGSHPHR